MAAPTPIPNPPPGFVPMNFSYVVDVNVQYLAYWILAVLIVCALLLVSVLLMLIWIYLTMRREKSTAAAGFPVASPEPTFARPSESPLRSAG